MRLPGRGSDAVSPTADYTGYVWAKNGLSHPALSSWRGRAMFELVQPWMLVNQVLGQDTLESYLLARHRTIDRLLEAEIQTEGEVQAIEVACGLSPRGWRFRERYGDRLTYIEADLPNMAVRKRRALERMGSLGERHRVEELDALRDGGPDSLAEIAASLDVGVPLVIITEGLLSYLDREQVGGLWARFADTLAGFRAGRYLSDLHVSEDTRGPQVEVFRLLLSAFVRGAVRLHFEDAPEAEAALKDAGFGEATVRGADSHLTRIVDARP